MKKYAIIVAGGVGKRMGKNLPKQFLLLKQKPILLHTLQKFFDYDKNISILLILPKEVINDWKEISEKYKITIPHQIIEGGKTRAHSVRNGLEKIEDKENSLVAIHDGVRPLVNLEIIEKSFVVAQEKGNAITAVKPKDSLRQNFENTTKTVNREEFYLVQTPQTFQTNIIWKAYQQEILDNFTDDASVLESKNNTIYLIEGSYQNIKITTPEDLLIAEAFLA
jgi:2-C-methyl-D-erythritol 4-phosphate cytidylyltransferase